MTRPAHPLAALASLPLLGALATCTHAPNDSVNLPPADLTFSVRKGAVTGPDSSAAGWTRVRVEEDGGGHIVVIFRLAESASDADIKTFLAALDTADATPAPALALGGPEVGDIGDVVVQLTPGRYVLGCVRRGWTGHRHASRGEATVLVATNGPMTAGRDAAPVATQELQMVDFAYVGPERWPAGSHMLRVRNGGSQEHQLRLARLRPGSSLNDWINAGNPDKIATPIAGVARLGPGGVAYLPVELPGGDYVAYCLITDPKSGRRHVELGMVRAIRVD